MRSHSACPRSGLPGLYLAVATFAFAAAIPSVLFNQKLFGWLLPDGGVTRPTLPFIDFEDERSMYFLALVCTGDLAARTAQRTQQPFRTDPHRPARQRAERRVGRDLTVASEARRPSGSPARLAGFAGALLAFQQRGVTAQGFGAEASVDLFVASVMGGIGSIAGPVLGVGVINALRTSLSTFPELATSITPLVAIVILYIAPAGIVSVLAKMRDSVLRIVAQRNDLVVPSLFADVDPESLHLRLVPDRGAQRERRARAHAPSLRRDSVHADDREVRRTQR